jgi:hypothetical protein
VLNQDPSPDCSCDYCRRLSREIDRTSDKLINEPAAQDVCGGVSHMWFRRRLAEPRFRFPEPVFLGRRRMYWRGDLVAWIASPHARLRTDRNFEEAVDAAA